MNLHNIIIFSVVGLIILYQIGIYRNTINKIQSFRNIFGPYIDKYRLEEIFLPDDQINAIDADKLNNLFSDFREEPEGPFIKVSVICYDETENTVMKNILNSLNTYLIKNKGAASDFLLIKDIVERNCDGDRDEINVEIPMPLYLGLMGTMAGIIVGLGYIGLVDGFTNFVNNPGPSLEILMSGVAIAMIASFIGIFLTTKLSWKFKSVNSETEKEKNKFYSWVQTRLLPVLSGNAVNSIYVLQNNLNSFNKQFSENVNKMDDAFGKINQAYLQQVEMLKIIEKLDVGQMSTANVSVLSELQKCMGGITTLGKYLNTAGEYLDQVSLLNNNLNSHLERTGMIEKMGRFFETEISSIEQRKSEINRMVGSIDNVLKKSFEELQDNAAYSMIEMKNTIVRQHDMFKKVIDEQSEGLRNSLSDISGITSVNHNRENDTKEELKINSGKIDELRSSVEKLITVMQKETENRILEKAGNNIKPAGKIRVIRNMLLSILIIILLLPTVFFVYERYGDSLTGRDVQQSDDPYIKGMSEIENELRLLRLEKIGRAHV